MILSRFKGNSRECSKESNRISELEKEKNELLRQIGQLKEQNITLEDQNNELTRILEDAEKNLKISEAQTKELQNNLEQLENRLSDIKLDCENWKQKFDHLDKEAGRLAQFPIRETVEIYNEYMSGVYNDTKDLEDIEKIKNLIEIWTNHHIKQLVQLGYKVYNHPRDKELMNDYRCSEPRTETTGNKIMDGCVKKCGLFGIDFPGDQPPILSSLYVYKYDPTKDPEENAFVKEWEPTPEELYKIMIVAYSSANNIDFNPEDENQEYDETDVKDYLAVDIESARIAYTSIRTSDTVNADVMDILFKNNIDTYIRISVSLGII